MLAAFTRFPDAGLVGNVQRNAATGMVDHAGIFFNHKGKPQHDTALSFASRRVWLAGLPPGRRTDRGDAWPSAAPSGNNWAVSTRASSTAVRTSTSACVRVPPAAAIHRAAQRDPAPYQRVDRSQTSRRAELPASRPALVRHHRPAGGSRLVPAFSSSRIGINHLSMMTSLAARRFTTGSAFYPCRLPGTRRHAPSHRRRT